jgi:hypothetical protein
VRLEKGIAMGCSISPILFVLVMEVILRGTGCARYLKAFMDDITILEDDLQKGKEGTRAVARISGMGWNGI